MRQNIRVRQFCRVVAIVLWMAATVQAYEGARIIAKTKVNVYRDGQLIQVVKQDAPLPEGALLKPEGDCGVRLAYMSLVGKDGCLFGVREDGATVELRVDTGTVYFAATGGIEGFVILTPPGAITSKEITIAATDPKVLKGYVQVENDKVIFGLLEGGDMVVSTPEGEQVIAAGEQIVLIQNSEKVALGLLRGKIPPALLASGTAAFGMILFTLDDDPSPTSPASPAKNAKE